MMKRILVMVVVAALMLPGPVLAQQATGEVWRAFAQKLDAGSDVMVRLQNGQRFRATLIEAQADALVLQPRTRRPVPVQRVGYDAVTVLERHTNRDGSIGRAVAIGAAVGAGTFLAIVAILAASLD